MDPVPAGWSPEPHSSVSHVSPVGLDLLDVICRQGTLLCGVGKKVVGPLQLPAGVLQLPPNFRDLAQLNRDFGLALSPGIHQIFVLRIQLLLGLDDVLDFFPIKLNRNNRKACHQETGRKQKNIKTVFKNPNRVKTTL